MNRETVNEAGRAISGSSLLVFAAMLLAFVSVQVAVAGPAGDGASKASHGKKHPKSSKQQFRRLRDEVRALRGQVAALQGQSGAAATPSGAAGGDLTGTYPNPTIAANAIGGAEVTDGSLLSADFNPLNVNGLPGTPSLRTLGAGGQQATAGDDPRLSDARTPTGAAGGGLTGTYPSPTIANGAVHAAGLTSAGLRNDFFTATHNSVTFETLSCDTGERLLSGGMQIAVGSPPPLVDPDIQVVLDAPSGPATWAVGVSNADASSDLLFEIRVLCLGV